MRLVYESSARRLVSLAILLFFTIPFGLSVTGCAHHAAAVVYCNGQESGPAVGQLYSIQLSPTLAVTGESLNYGQIGQSLSATGYDCKGNTVSTGNLRFGTSNMFLADINPGTGSVCGGTWNRNTGGNIPDYTTCTAPTSAATKNGTDYLSYVTATANGITSNAIPVYVHPLVTGIVFGKSAGGCSTDPDTTCCPNSTTTTVTAPYYDGTSCVSQNQTAQIAARVYTNNDTLPADNITCKAGHLTFSTPGSGNIVSLDQNGVATAEQPGSTTLTAQLANSSSASTIGFFSTCPPASISLSAVGQGTSTSVNVPINNTQPLTATVLDTKGHPITGLNLEFESTTPQIIPGSSSVVPTFPGSATITAVCQPPMCNTAPFNQIGYLGNGKPITSNGIDITAAGTSTSEIFVASTNSQYLLPVDFSTGLTGALVKLPYVPNSMVITLDGTVIYMGSPGGLMTYNTGSNLVSSTNISIQGTVISVSPDGNTLVVTDPSRNTISLVTSGGAVETSYDGVATHAQWSPDSQTVYITTTGNTLLTHSNFTNWQVTPIQPSADPIYNDVTVMTPSIGAYFAGPVETDGRSYCSLTTQTGTGTPPTENNQFTPLADQKPVAMDRIASTPDGHHILGASVAAGVSDIYLADVTSQANNNQPKGPQSCSTTTGQVTFTSTSNVRPFAGITPTAITGVDPASNSDIAFVTFNGTGNGLLPYYLPSTSSAAGSLNYFSLANKGTAPNAPVNGVFATDNKTFYVTTDGDNLVHEISLSYPSSGAPTLTDSGEITPNLPSATGSGTATPNLITQRPRAVKSGV